MQPQVYSSRKEEGFDLPFIVFDRKREIAHIRFSRALLAPSRFESFEERESSRQASPRSSNGLAHGASCLPINCLSCVVNSEIARRYAVCLVVVEATGCGVQDGKQRQSRVVVSV